MRRGAWEDPNSPPKGLCLGASLDLSLQRQRPEDLEQCCRSFESGSLMSSNETTRTKADSLSYRVRNLGLAKIFIDELKKGLFADDISQFAKHRKADNLTRVLSHDDVRARLSQFTTSRGRGGAVRCRVGVDGMGRRRFVGCCYGLSDSNADVHSVYLHVTMPFFQPQKTEWLGGRIWRASFSKQSRTSRRDRSPSRQSSCVCLYAVRRRRKIRH